MLFTNSELDKASYDYSFGICHFKDLNPGLPTGSTAFYGLLSILVRNNCEFDYGRVRFEETAKSYKTIIPTWILDTQWKFCKVIISTFYKCMSTAGVAWVVSVLLKFYSWSMSNADFEDYKQLFIGLVMPAHMDTMGKGPKDRLHLQSWYGWFGNKTRHVSFYKMKDMTFDNIILDDHYNQSFKTLQ